MQRIMANPQNKINIIYPITLGNAQPKTLALCEVIIGSLINAKKREIYFKVNISEGYVESNLTEIKYLLTLLLKTRQMEEFISIYLFITYINQ